MTLLRNNRLLWTIQFLLAALFLFPGGVKLVMSSEAMAAQTRQLSPLFLKFIGTMEQGKKKVAIFSDGRGLPVYASEGELVLGQYKVVRIQLESVVMEYADGRGHQVIPMRGEFGRQNL